jgi:outer membrane receptor for ferrienterochelin and colicin
MRCPTVFRYLAIALAVAAHAQTGDLTKLSLEDLMGMDITSVAKREQKLSQAAAAIYVITQEEIRRSGLTSIPELLRLVPGMSVARITATSGPSLRAASTGDMRTRCWCCKTDAPCTRRCSLESIGTFRIP